MRKLLTSITIGLILTGLDCLILVSCNPPAPVEETTKTVTTSAGELTKDNTNYNTNYNLVYEEYSLEGCQYIVVSMGASRWGSHKGNCTNPIHNK